MTNYPPAGGQWQPDPNQPYPPGQVPPIPGGYQQGYPQQGYPQPGYQAQGYPQQSYAPEGYPVQPPMPPVPATPGTDDLDTRASYQSTEDTRTYPCPSCGGFLAWNPDNQALACESCGSSASVDERLLAPCQIPKRDVGQAMAELQARQSQEAAVESLDKEIVCQSCGGHTVFTGTLTQQRCPYCNTPIQRDDVQKAPTRLPIDGILPLRISQRTAEENIIAWINSRWFAPNAFKKYRELGSFTSIYMPYFSYDSATTTSYTGEMGIDRTETYTDSDGETHTRTVTDWYPASGIVDNEFVDVTGHASEGLNDDDMRELEPWPLEDTCRYSPIFTAGHLSRTYDYDVSQVFDHETRPRMENEIDSTIRLDIGGDHQRIYSRNIDWHFLNFCQLALPIWMLTVTFQNKPYNVVINGLTGEVQGRRPWSWIKITLAVLAALIVIGILCYLIAEYS